MKQLSVIILFLGCITAQNNYPIVLIHGFMGWGPNELGGYHYWGGRKDYVKMLELDGHVVFVVSVGPVSSNWERAIEVYYQLKGGQVDYGRNHSEKHNIIQEPEGKSYEAIYPEWDENHPVHLIGHSMGGQTARMLNYLLTQEIYEDEENKVREQSDLLGGVQRNLIKSITAISAPHNGTTLTEVVTKTIPFIQYFVGVAGVVGTQFYNFDLEQWGFNRKEDETWASYINRMRTHDAWQTKNMSSWDLSLDGAQELNGFLQAEPDVFYFSFVTSTTQRQPGFQIHIPIEGTPILIRTRSKLLGSRVGYWSDGSQTDSLWYENDGVVNTISMYGPSTGSNGPDPIVEYDENELLIPGQWYWIKVCPMDHWNIIGHLGSKERMEAARMVLKAHGNRLKTLPPN